MAHLQNYTITDLEEILCELNLPTSGKTKQERVDRLKGVFTKEKVGIFESYGGFEKKPGDATVCAACLSKTQYRLPQRLIRMFSLLRRSRAQKAELEHACVANGLPKTGNAIDLMIRLAAHKVPRGSCGFGVGGPPMREPLQQVPASQPGKKPITAGDLVRVVLAGDSYYEEFGKVESLEKGGMMVRFVSGKVVGYKPSSLMQCSGWR